MKSFTRYLMVLVPAVVLLSIYIPIRYQISYPREIGPEFDPSIRKNFQNDIDTIQPDIVLLGDSMLGPAVDSTLLAEQLDQNIYTISLPGTASTIWYLIIKNNIVLAEHKPKTLVIFFRDSMMTVPGYRVTGRYFELVDEYAGPNDKVLIQRAYLNPMNPLEKFAEGYFPIYNSRWKIRQSMDYYIRYSLPDLFGCDKDCVDNGMENVFQENNVAPNFLSDALAASDTYLYTDKVLNFRQQVDDSFLPEVIRLCKENDIQLILVRMKIMRFPIPVNEPPALEGYAKQMALYLEQNDVIFFDFAHDPRLTVDDFDDIVHLNEKGRAIFTPILADSLKPYIP
jgi:hypothetical protein